MSVEISEPRDGGWGIECSQRDNHPNSMTGQYLGTSSVVESIKSQVNVSPANEEL